MAGMNTLDRRTGLDRRAATERRGAEDGSQPFARAVGSPATLIADRRRVERRGAERRATNDEPQLACPVCHGRLEYEVMLSWNSPAAYTVDTGYCALCSRRFLRTRHTGWYDSMSWAPLCRVCREPVAFVRALHDRRMTAYHCPMHPEAVWEYDTVTDGWAVRA